MKFFRIIFLAISLAACSNLCAQIQVSPYVFGSSVDGIEEASSDILENKLKSILSQNGILSKYGDSRFVLTAHLISNGKEALSSMPVKVVSRISATFVIGDGESGTRFASKEIEITGVGENDYQATMNAIRSLNGKSESISELIQTGTERIIQYYEKNAPIIMKSAMALSKSGNYDEAIYELVQIPQEYSDYEKVQSLLGTIMKERVDYESATYLNEATAQWSTNPTAENAPNIIAALSKIDPNAACYPQALKLMSKIEAQAKLEQTREYQLKNKVIESAAELQKSRLKAAESIAVAYARSLPKTIYHIQGWW